MRPPQMVIVPSLNGGTSTGKIQRAVKVKEFTRFFRKHQNQEALRFGPAHTANHPIHRARNVYPLTISAVTPCLVIISDPDIISVSSRKPSFAAVAGGEEDFSFYSNRRPTGLGWVRTRS